MTEISQKPLIPSRVMLIGEGHIPRSVIENLEDYQTQIFLREPDPGEWPPEMGHLVQYLPEEERTVFAVAAVLARHEDLLASALERWASAAWKDLTEETIVSRGNIQTVLGEMAKYLRALVVKYLEDRQ